jgi:PTS system cellobiose-specific IIA component
MEKMDLLSFEIITYVGSARSMYIDAIRAAKLGNFEEAEKLMVEGSEFFLKGHRAHAGLIQKEAGGEKSAYSLLLVHAEDLLMSAETFKILAEEFIALYRRIS